MFYLQRTTFVDIFSLEKKSWRLVNKVLADYKFTSINSEMNQCGLGSGISGLELKTQSMNSHLNTQSMNSHLNQCGRGGGESASNSPQLPRRPLREMTPSNEGRGGGD